MRLSNPERLSCFILLAAIVLASACVSTPRISAFAFNGVTIKWLGHAGFEITGPKKIFIDPFLVNATEKADIVLVSHGHFDHCDTASIKNLQRQDTRIFGMMDCIKNLTGLTNLLRPGESATYPDGTKIEAVQAYNINKPYHQKGTGIGFLITTGNVTIYHAGDTDFIPEMNDIRADIALLPIGGKYTMNAEEAAEAAKAINPKVVVPMHYNSGAFGIGDIGTEPQKLAELLKGTGIEVKILGY